jgi:hypothetical protein
MDRIMKQVLVAAVAVALFAAGSGCKSNTQANLPPLSTLSVSQPRAESQLIDGFWQVENNAWRWTRHDFSVLLMPPPGAAQNGATLEFRFTLPDVIIDKRQSLTLTATVGNVKLPPETYTASGSYVYKSDVPAAAFQAGVPVKVAFATDKYLRAGEVERRELALIANVFALNPK